MLSKSLSFDSSPVYGKPSWRLRRLSSILEVHDQSSRGDPELLLQFGDRRDPSLTKQPFKIEFSPTAALDDEERILPVLRVVSHQLAKQEILVAEPEKAQFLPIATDPPAILPPFVRQDHLIFDEQVAHIEPFWRESLVELIQRLPEICSLTKCLRLADPEHCIDIEALGELLGRIFKAQEKRRPTVERELDGRIEPAVEFS